MRTISSNGLAKLATTHGNEPVCIVEIDWSAGGVTASYADKDIAGPPAIPGKIVELSDLDEAIDVTMQNAPSQQVSITLDDTDGSIKTIFDKYDIHKRPVRLYQWFTGLDLSDKFLVFAGLINTPATWNERDRTVKFDVVSQIEDKELGFSADEGQFPYIPAEMVGKAWPMIFGLVYDYPALKVNMAVEGTTLTGAGILAGLEYQGPLYENGTNSDNKKLEQLTIEQIHRGHLWQAASCWEMVSGGVGDAAAKSRELLDAGNQISEQIGAQIAQIMRQEACARQRLTLQVAEANLQGLGPNPIQILGGEDFPQNTPITLNINGGLFYGHFEGQAFYVSSRVNPQIEGEVEATIANNLTDQRFQQARLPFCTPLPSNEVKNFDYRTAVPCGTSADFYNPCELRTYGFLIPRPRSSITQQGNIIIRQFWADAGTKAVLYTTPAVTYIASITPGTVLAVKAFQVIDGVRRLTVVPKSLYTVTAQNYGSVTAVQVVLNQPLSQVWFTNAKGDWVQGWSDELYLTFQSSVGPNIVDILEYIIDNYTDLTYDTDSFDDVRTKLAPFPANFPILQRKNTVEVLKEIAFQSRCAFWLEDNVVDLKYLPEEPTPVDTITVSDMDADKGVEVELAQRTEDIVTKMNVTWRLTNVPGYEYSAEQASQTQYMTLRHNVQRYGLHEKDYDWYIFNQPDIVLKMATFWLIRLSSAWKRVKFRTYLHKLALEAFDCVTFNAPGYVASGPVKMVVEKAAYNSAENCIDFECSTPVKAGTMTQDVYYWPAALPQTTLWPPPEDIISGDAGGGGIGKNASGQLPVGMVVPPTMAIPTPGFPAGTNPEVEFPAGQWRTVQLVQTGSAIFVGGPNVVFRGPADWGDPTPTDVGFQAQPLPLADQYSAAAPSSRPVLNLRTYPLRDSDPMQVARDPVTFVIDLKKTQIMDSSGTGDKRVGYLSDVFALSPPADNSGGRLMIDLSNARVMESNPEATQTWSDGLIEIFVLTAGPDGGNQLMIDGRSEQGAYYCTDDADTGARFDFKLDTETNLLGAGTAFLQSP